MKFATKCVILMIAVAAVMVPADAYAKKVKKNLYLFGCSASFTDSIIYITDVQVIENANYDTRSKMLVNREMYSSQLKEYLAEKMGQPHRTCFVMFSDKAKKITKKLGKVRALYTTKSSGKFDVKYLKLDDFRFTIIKDEEESATEE
ncbi:MAG: hypothetical protein Q4F85_09835 [Prevotella sp.]|nr:hypothetical protein [Prevotella sp.]